MSMGHYLAVIRRADFLDLYKFGQLYIRHAISFDGLIENHRSDSSLFFRLVCSMNAFEYSFEYLIAHFMADADQSGNRVSDKVNIKDLQEIFALDVQAQKQMRLSFDQRIQVKLSPWSDMMSKLFISHEKSQRYLGIDNLSLVPAMIF